MTAGEGFLVVTSRASFELVQKAAICGVPILAAVSRPTGLAVRMADAAGMGLVGLVRGQSANVYAQSFPHSAGRAVNACVEAAGDRGVGRGTSRLLASDVERPQPVITAMS